MSDLGNLGNVAGANTAFARSVPAARTESLAPATVQNAVSKPINTPETAVTQSPTASSTEWPPPTDPDGQKPRPTAAPDPEQLAATLDDLNQRLNNYQTNLRFDMDDQYQQMVVRIVDQETKAVVLQIPSETALALAKAFKELEANNQLGSPTSPVKTGNPGNPRSPVDGWLLRATA